MKKLLIALALVILSAISCRAFGPEIFFFAQRGNSFSYASTTSLSLNITTNNSSATTIYWGDGTSTAATSGTGYSHTFAIAQAGSVRVVTAGAAYITQWYSDTGTWNFNLSGLPSGLTTFYCAGSNTIAGNLSVLPSGITTFTCYGNNTITGNLSSLPSGITTFTFGGNNTITGNLSSLPSGITYFACSGFNTITGNLSSLPSGITYFACSGFNTVTGNLSVLPSGITYFLCTGSNTIAGYSTRTWHSGMQQVYLVPISPGGLTSAEVDQLLTDLAAQPTWSSAKVVYLKGTNGAPTSASAAAITTLQGYGVTVTTN